MRVPRFFFHLYDDTVVLDGEGMELPDVDTAEQQAIEIAREMASFEVAQGHLGLNHRIEVADAAGAEVLTVHFKDAVMVHP